MLLGMGVVCILLGYFVAFCFEIARLFFPKKASLFAALSFVSGLLGAIAHFIFLYNNDFIQNESFFPIASGWFFVLSFGIVLIGLYLAIAYPKTQFSLFLVPLVLIICCVAIFTRDVQLARETTFYYARTIHTVSLILASASSIFGTVSGIMFSVQRSRLKKKSFTHRIVLPSLEWSSRAARVSINNALIFLGFGIASGFYLKIFTTISSNTSVNGMSVDPVAIGATILFIIALVSHIRKVFFKESDLVSRDAKLAFFCSIALLSLLLYAASSNSGHWRVVPSMNSSQDLQKPNMIEQSNSTP